MDNEKKLGSIIRGHRLNKSMTLKDLSDKTGLSVSFLSDIERNAANPSVPSLRRISNALEVSILDFGEGASDNELSNKNESGYVRPSSARDVKVVRSNHRISIKFPGKENSYELLVPDFKRSMQAMYQKLEPNYDQIEPLMELPGEKFLYVISGDIEYTIDGECYNLVTGDSMYYHDDGPVYCINKTSEPSEVLIVVTSPNL